MAKTSVLLVAAGIVLAALAAPHTAHVDAATKPVYGAYVLLTRGRGGQTVGMTEFDMLVKQANTIPINRLWIAFFSPSMVYVPGSMKLHNTGMNLTDDADLGFAKLKAGISVLQKAGVEVFLSMGGWNYNCFPYAYMQYSVGGYGPNTPNYWKIEQFGGGDKNNCNEANQFCWVCEPPSENTTLSDFGIFPLPEHSETWQQAVQYVVQNAKGSKPPSFNYDLKPNNTWTDPNTTRTILVPGSDLYDRLGRDPYADFVSLAKDLGAAGIDLDYEEFWHADLFKLGNQPGPFELPQTVYKYNAIAKDLIINIQKLYPTLKLSTAAGAVGAWQSAWWGGNLKGVWALSNQWYPANIQFMASGPNAGGIDVMSYDLSKDEKFHECPKDDVCSLHEQVDFYMDAYTNATIPAMVGYEIGIPAYPSPVHDKENQLPLTQDELTQIIQTTQPKFKGGFFWAIFKPTGDPANVSPTVLAQTLCKTLDPSSPRCKGTLPNYTPPSN